ncbi:Gfo/Idh/MocA family protein [Nocardia sp. BMG51109]|uniref:Gfo/Idh/MocA family protein n=1 Tax=Nocardia sp. BMG51109 TaxID=1056816 RepID=UPI0004BAE9C3|nr:Gfo/Idh/MocA family oxidoreductase [Nocardia sp. BMG51109]
MGSTRPVTAALVGYGYWGARLLDIASRVDGLRITRVVDIRCGAADFAGPASIPCGSDLDAAVADPRIDAVIVATTASAHDGPIRQALSAGKHVFTEKPFTLTTRHATELLRLARDRNLMVTVDHQYWWSREIAALGAALDRDAIGEVVAVSIERAADGPVRYDVNALWDLAIHDVAVLVRLGILGDGPGLHVEDCRETGNGPVAGCVALTARAPAGIEVRLHACWLSRGKRRALVITGERGSLRLEESDRTLSAWLVEDRRRSLLSRTAKSAPGTPIELALGEFVRGVRGGPDLRPAADAARVVTVLEDMHGSAGAVTQLVRSDRCLKE